MRNLVLLKWMLILGILFVVSGGSVVDEGLNNFMEDPVINWDNPADIIYGTPLGPTHLSATAVDVDDNSLFFGA